MSCGALQQRLAELGYRAGSADGSLTTQAVLAVRQAAGLSRGGVVGPRTLPVLEAGTRPSARGGGDAVEIDLERQLLLVVRGGGVRTVLTSTAASWCTARRASRPTRPRTAAPG